MLDVVLFYVFFSFLVTSLIVSLYMLYLNCVELRMLQRNTYNSYMNMVQGIEDYEEKYGKEDV